METKTDWLNEKYDQIEDLSKDFSISKYNLLKISFLKRLIEESLIHSKTCTDCKNHLVELESMIEKIPLLDQIDHRSPYEKRFNTIRGHFHKKHGFIPPYHYSTLWTLGGIILGVVSSIAISFFLYGRILLDPILAGLALGLIVGYLIGSTKEASYRKSKKII
jgi:hypothetical protein